MGYAEKRSDCMSERIHYYTDEKNAQIVIALLKAHGIRKVIANPGTTNMPIVGSVQNDPWFEVYSAVDERHASYMAVGMAVESGEPVVLSCTGATASRNYMSALTEAYYRKVPILAITSVQCFDKIGHLYPQSLDRTVIPNDVAYRSFQCRTVKDGEDAWSCALKVNAAILELSRHGCGPVHINLEMCGADTFNTERLPHVRKVTRYDADTIGAAPEIAANSKIAIFLGSGRCDPGVDKFAREHNAVVFADESRSYDGEFDIVPSLIASQTGSSINPKYAELKPNLIVDAGEVSGDYPSQRFFNRDIPIWRVSTDGELRSRFRRIDNVFEMSMQQFADHYSSTDSTVSHDYYNQWKRADSELRDKIPDLPFSNPWIASQLSSMIPEGSVLHLGILNSLRSWNEFPASRKVETSSNVGGFGIDGAMSTLLGASLVNQSKTYFAVIGDLAFFYDLNALGNRLIGKNIRILVVNNGCGAEFNMFFHPGSQFGAQANQFIAAGGHFGNKSRTLVRDFIANLGFKYLCASSKSEFTQAIKEFVCTDSNVPIVMECFTDVEDESNAHKLLYNIESYSTVGKASVLGSIKSIVPGRVKNAIKELVR